MTFWKYIHRALLGAALAAGLLTAAQAQYPGSGAQPVTRGGTGKAALNQNNLIFGNGTAPVGFIAPGTNGRCLVDNGTIWTPGLCISGSTISGVDTNTLNTQVANYTISTSDCGKTIQAGTGSAGKFTVTLPSVSGFASTCSVIVINDDTVRGKIMSGFPSDIPSTLFPLQSVKVEIINGAWATVVKPGRWKLPGATTIYVDNTGSNTGSNDGLAPGSTGAFASVLGALDTIFFLIDLNGQTLTVQNASGQNLADLTFSGQFTGSGKFIFDGGGATINANANAAAIYVSMPVTGQISVAGTSGTPLNLFLIQNMTITCSSGNHNGLLVSAGYVSLNGGSGAGGNINFGTCGAAQISADGSGSRIFNLGNYTISGGAAEHLQQIAGGLIDFNANSNTTTITGTPAFSTAFAVSQFGGGCMIIANAWSGSATGSQYLASGNGCIVNGTGTTLPGSAAGTTTTGGYISPFSKTAYSVYSADSTGTTADFGPVHLDQSGAVTAVLPVANGGTGNTSGAATTNANMTGAVTSVGNATSLGSFSSASLAGALTDEVGTGKALFNAIALGNVQNVDQTNAANISSGTLANARSAATNLAAGNVNGGVTGVLPFANGGTNDSGTGWTAYTPTATAQTPGATPPTFTSVTGRSKQIGAKTFVCQMEVVVNVAGTGAGSLRVTLPFTSASNNYVGSAFESAIAGKSGAAIIIQSISTAFLSTRDATGTTWFANGADVSIEITYEVP